MSIKKKLHEYKRELILEEAGKLFVQEGYEAMKIADLAKISGVSVGTIYNMFGSKENLYNHYIMKMVEHAMETLRNSLQHYNSPIDKVREVTRIKFELICQHKLPLKESMNDPSFFLHISDDRDNPMMQVYDYLAEAVMKPLADEIRSTKKPMELVFLFDGLTIGAIKYWMACDGDLMERVDATVEQFLQLAKGPQ
jgi:AcrR family transcriptional regulator